MACDLSYTVEESKNHELKVEIQTIEIGGDLEVELRERDDGFWSWIFCWNIYTVMPNDQ